MMTFDDDYPTCRETHVTLRVFSEDLQPSEMTDCLGISPTEAFAKGEPIGSKGRARKRSGWFLSSLGLVSSRDARRHLAWLLDRLELKQDALQQLRNAGAELDISCYYVSIGQGGPTLSAEQMVKLGQLGLDLWWDIYFDSTDDSRTD